MKVWLVMCWDYSQTHWVGIFDSIEAVFAAYPDTPRCKWSKQDDGSWEQSGTRGYSAEEVEVETMTGVPRKGVDQ